MKIPVQSLLLICLLFQLVKSNEDDQWKEYKLQYNKVYTEDEETHHKKIFNQNLIEITFHNLRYLDHQETYKKGINQFTDQSAEDRRQSANSKVTLDELRKTKARFIRTKLRAKSTNPPIPSSFNWLDKGAVTPVKNQGKCGSCYAFASSAVFETQYFRTTGVLRNFSEQNLVDCVPDSEGCVGGYPVSCFEYVYNNGLMFEEHYNYTGTMGDSCEFHSEKGVFPLSDYLLIEAGDEKRIIQMIATQGPVVVALDDRHFHDYSEGILDETRECGETNHVVALVGYGTDVETGYDYYLAKNSWGDWWGESGYLRIARNINYCSLAEFAIAPIFNREWL